MIHSVDPRSAEGFGPFPRDLAPADEARADDPPSFATANYGEIRPAIHPRCKQRSILAKADKGRNDGMSVMKVCHSDIS